ncbi:hypothetical protein Tco_0927346 [Tanacetum coccineum]
MIGTSMGTIRFAIHGDPDRYRTPIGNARARSKIAKGLTILVTMGSSQQALDRIHGVGQANSSVLSQLASEKKIWNNTCCLKQRWID